MKEKNMENSSEIIRKLRSILISMGGKQNIILEVLELLVQEKDLIISIHDVFDVLIGPYYLDLFHSEEIGWLLTIKAICEFWIEEGYLFSVEISDTIFHFVINHSISF